MTDIENLSGVDETRALTVHQLAAHRRLVSYAGLSATTTESSDGGGRETAYRLHLMDMASRRMKPHLLGVSERGCDHLACDMVLLNSLLAGYMVEMGWANEHSNQYALALLNQNGYNIDLV